MATRKPSAATALKNLKVEHAALQQQAAKLEAELKNKTAESDRWYKSRGEFEAELQQAHTLLDALPGAIPHDKDGNSYGGKNALMTRLAAWFATGGRVREAY